MGEKKQKNQGSKKEPFERVTVYLPPKLKEEMDDYIKEKKYGNRSEMFRKAFQILKHVFPLGESTETSLHQKLDQVLDKIDEVHLAQERAKAEQRAIDSEFKNYSNNDLNLTSIAIEIFETIKDPEKFNGIVKDFVLMDYFRDKYSRGIIFKALLELVNKNKLIERDGLYEIRKE